MKNKVNITIKSKGISFTNSKYKNLGSGWHNESSRHSLARRGYKTISGLENNLIRKYPNLDFDNDGLKNKDDCEPFNDKEQGKVHDFLNRALDILKDKHKDDPEKIKEIEEARKDIGKISTKEKFKEWIRLHKRTLAIAGTGGLVIGILTAFVLGGQMNISNPSQVPLTVEFIRGFLTFTGGVGTEIGIKETIEGSQEEELEKDVITKPITKESLQELEKIGELEENQGRSAKILIEDKLE